MRHADELNLLYDWDAMHPPKPRLAAAGSVLVHLLLLVLVALMPDVPVRRYDFPEVRMARRKMTPLIAPRFELTQKEANKGKLTKDVTLEALMPRPSAPAKQAPAGAPAARQFTPPPTATAPAPQAMMPEPPKLVAQGNANIATPQIELPAPPPPVVEKPKLAFETPGQPRGGPQGGALGNVRIATPKSNVDDVVRQTIRMKPNGGVVVTDMMDLPAGAGATLSATPNQGRAGSSLELLSDPQGIDFKPYLIRVLAAVRRNWFAVLPESARFGQRGRVLIQFAIAREGRVPKLVISTPSGVDALDRAAVAGISASNPFPPLPAEFKGDQIRLQLSFAYNMPVVP
ncbi:MAG: TonB family protein [Acidobacteria bacterium]|nr:TonB family protein [Acidobacteriota bacterium]